MSKIRIVLWDEPSGREGVVDTFYDFAGDEEADYGTWLYYESGNGACDCNRFFPDETWDEGKVPECTEGERWILDVLTPDGRSLGTPDESDLSNLTPSPAFIAKLAEYKARRAA